MKLIRLEPLSLSKILAAVYAAFGLIVGTMMTFVYLAGIEMPGLYSVQVQAMGPYAILLMPLYNGIAGAIGGYLMAHIYNFAAKKLGGIELEMK